MSNQQSKSSGEPLKVPINAIVEVDDSSHLFGLGRRPAGICGGVTSHAIGAGRQAATTRRQADTWGTITFTGRVE